jgi:cyanophycinase-like exopeptidase
MATKCDLVLAHNELELNHEENIKRRDVGLLQLRKANFSLVEAQSEVEKDLLNEIYGLTQKIKGLEAVHMKDIEEREEMHRKELSSKDHKIAKLQEEIRRIRNGKKQSKTPVSLPALPAFLKK